MLEAFADRQADTPISPPSVETRVTRTVLRGPPGPYLMSSGSSEDVLMELLQQCLLSGGGEKLRRCSECRTLFVRTGRQTYCRRSGCEAQRRQSYWQAYVVTPTGRKARRRALKRHYSQGGWKLGSRGGWTGLDQKKAKHGD